MGLCRTLVVASVMAMALAGIVAADYNQKKPAALYNKPAAYVAAPRELSVGIQVQGIIYCRSKGKLSPLPGAMARLTCIAFSGRGRYESAPFSVVSKATDAKGYFKINLSKYEVGPYKLTACKLFLETPPPGECSFPTDDNHGISGASLPDTYRVLADNTHLYSVHPLAYTLPPY